jgi:hypothetical protein
VREFSSSHFAWSFDSSASNAKGGGETLRPRFLATRPPPPSGLPLWKSVDLPQGSSEIREISPSNCWDFTGIAGEVGNQPLSKTSLLGHRTLFVSLSNFRFVNSIATLLTTPRPPQTLVVHLRTWCSKSRTLQRRVSVVSATLSQFAGRVVTTQWGRVVIAAWHFRVNIIEDKPPSSLWAQKTRHS